ncbi:MAG TPA: hypothetical protein VHB68_03025 [Steroidobacteraceae bacterium]|nr:hypothetical protein [Steroidobacteraceae bacterium]
MSRILITLMALWTSATLLWLLLPNGTPDQLLTRARSSLQRLDRDIAHTRIVEPPRTTRGTGSAPGEAAAGQQSASVTAVSNQTSSAEPMPVPRPVYRATAEQLSRDYEANAVATQARIGASRVRLSGDVVGIDQDTAQRPVVKLGAGEGNTAALTLVEEQRAAAAQLVKGQAVEIECDRIGRSGASLEGSDCTLAVVDSGPREVNLALFLANENGPTRVYVVGPMPEAVCAERSAEISSRLQGSQPGEHVVLRNCTDAVRERIPPADCRLYTRSVSVADVPAAHLWRYDCGLSGVARTNRRKKTPTYPAARQATLASMSGAATMEPDAGSGGNLAAADDSSDSTAARPIPAPIVDSVAVPSALSGAPAGAAAPADPGTAAPAPAATQHTTTQRTATSNIRLASAGNPDTGAGAAVRISPEEPTVTHAAQSALKGPGSLQGGSQGTVSVGTATPPEAPTDDLARVRAADPQAADHIAGYCAQTTVSTGRDAYIADCRRREADAWTRLVQQNEFPTLDDAARKKCEAPPFPDTYVAKEICARYVLHVN